MDRANPLARGRMTLSAYCKAEHVFVTHNGEWQPLYIDVLKAKGVVLEPVVTLPSHDCLDRIIPGTPLIAAIPHHLARAMQSRLHVTPLPFRVPISIDVYWSVLLDRRSANLAALPNWLPAPDVIVVPLKSTRLKARDCLVPVRNGRIMVMLPKPIT